MLAERHHALDPERARTIDAELAGLDALEQHRAPRPRRGRRVWSGTWPKLVAVAIGVGLWQLVVWSGWKEDYVLPGPRAVLADLLDGLGDGTVGRAAAITLRRAASGFGLALVIGTVLGSLVARVRFLRRAFGSLITGLQTMPSIAWFPLAVMLFQLSEQAILFVVVLGAAPAIANGLITGADQVPPLLQRAGRMLGARGLAFYRHIVLPASLPSFVAGLKQGWAFSWRSLMAGELLVILPDKPSIGAQLQVARDFADTAAVMSTMVVILAIGIVVDAVFFATAERAIRRRWGMADPLG